MKKQNGITLIALVITIVVLLILAAVSISMVLGDNGILKKARQAGNDTTTATIQEYISNALISTEAEFLVNGGSTEADDWYTDATKGSKFFNDELVKSGATSGAINSYDTTSGVKYTGTMVMNGTTYNWTAINGKITF